MSCVTYSDSYSRGITEDIAFNEYVADTVMHRHNGWAHIDKFTVSHNYVFRKIHSKAMDDKIQRKQQQRQIVAVAVYGNIWTTPYIYPNTYRGNG